MIIIIIIIIIIRSWFGSLKSTPLNQTPPVVGKGGSSYANEMRISQNLTHPQPLWKDRGGIDVSGEKGVNIRSDTRNGKELRLLTAREEDQRLDRKACFAWLWEWSECPSYRVAGVYELYEQFLPTKFYNCKKKTTTSPVDVMCSL